MKSFLEGKKSYLVGAGMIAYAVIGWALSYQSADEAAKLAMAGLAVMGLRAGIAKS